MGEKTPDIGLQTVELKITDPESGEVFELFMVAQAQMDPQTFERIFQSGNYELQDVIKHPFKFSAPQDFLEAAGDERMQKFIDHIGEGIDAVAKSS